MKKPLLFMGALLLSSAVTVSTTACNNPTIFKKDLKKDLIQTDLKIVPEEHRGTIPTDYDLKSQLFILNHELHTDNIIIINKTTNLAFVVGDGIFYNQDKIKITYQIQTIDIRTIIVDGASIGNFATNGQKPTVEAVCSRIQEKYSNLEMDRLKIDVISNKEATITGDDVIPLYTGKVTVTFSTNDSVDLSTIINKKDLMVKTNGHDIPSNNDVMRALRDTYQEKLDTSFIAIEITAANSATITSTNQKKYTGKVILNLNLDIRIALKDVINKGLDKIAIRGKVITLEDVNSALKKQYSRLNMNAIQITLQNNSVTIKSINQYVYTGADVVINNLLIDLNSVLNNKLPTFNIPGQNTPSKGQLVSALKTANYNLDVSKIIVDKITDNSAVIKGDGKFYSNDNIVVTYDCDKTELLSDAFKNLNLGTIKTNGLSKPNIEEIKTAISKSNPNVKLDAIKFSEDDITNQQVTISGDETIYKGKVVADFTIDSSTINNNQLNYNYSETNSVGSLKTTWTSSDIPLLSNWTNYAPDWDSFSNKFSKLSFGDNSYFSLYCNTYTDQKLTGSQLSISTNDISNDRNKNIFELSYYHDGGFWGAFLELHGYIHIWHDEENVYVSINWSTDTVKCFRDRVWNINLQGVTFS
ncbi:hypothetical protein [Spiroplasma endosymbiont of Notiophilus biguttatus]|uniref:hypothetical protein n=1 Tax=Spiroplasma endosymbiont of Notiophilus biguttatus TaxID=3066285 RepID=UPI00313D4E24